MPKTTITNTNTSTSTKNSKIILLTKIQKPKITNFSQRFVTLSRQAKIKARLPIKALSLAKNITSIEKNSHKIDLPQSFIEPTITLTPTQSIVSKIDDLILSAQAQAGLVGFDEINKLIKKLTLSFSSAKSESSFFIKTGIFEGARFQIKCQERDLHLKVNNLAKSAHEILNKHRDYLHLRLSHKEINLASVMFNS